MALNFTKLTEVENIETPAAEATVIIEDEGSIKRTPMSNIGGGSPHLIVTAQLGEGSTLVDSCSANMTVEELVNHLTNGDSVTGTIKYLTFDAGNPVYYSKISVFAVGVDDGELIVMLVVDKNMSMKQDMFLMRADGIYQQVS